jgi:hypothetical protein
MNDARDRGQIPNDDQPGARFHPAIFPVAITLSAIVGAIFVAIRLNLPSFLLVVGIPMAITAGISRLFRSWKPLVALSTAYFYLMAFWLVGFVGNALHEWVGRDIAESLALDPRWLKLSFLFVFWGLLVYSIDKALALCFAALPDSDELVGDLPHAHPQHSRARGPSRTWTDAG